MPSAFARGIFFITDLPAAGRFRRFNRGFHGFLLVEFFLVLFQSHNSLSIRTSNFVHLTLTCSLFLAPSLLFLTFAKCRKKLFLIPIFLILRRQYFKK